MQTSTTERPISPAYLTCWLRERATLAQHIEVAAEAGYRYVSLRLVWNRGPDPTEDFRDEAGLREAERRLADTGLRVIDGEALWLTPGLQVADYVPLLETMQRFGAQPLLLLSDNPDDEQGFETFAELCERAAPYDVKPCLEFCKLTPLETIQQAVSWIERAGAPNGRILIDTLHLSRSGGTPQDVAAVNPALFEYIQLCDAPAEIPDWERMRQEPGDRLLPGDGGLPLVELLRVLPANLPISIEAPVRAHADLPPVERARRALAATRRVLDQVSVAV